MAASSGAVRGYGAKVELVVGTVSPVTTEILGIADFEFPDQTRGNIDVTTLRSPNDTEEFIRDMKSAPEWSLNHHYVPGSAMDTALAALKASGEDFVLKFTLPADTPVVVEFVAYVNSYRPTTVSPRGVMMATTVMTVKAEVVA